MDHKSRRNLISSMLLYCLAGDLSIRVNYGGILISRVESYIIEEVILKDPNHSYLTSIMANVEKVIDAALATRKDATTGLDSSKLKDLVIERVFPIDQTWAEAESLKSLTGLGDLAGIRIARDYYYAAIDAFAQSGKSALSYSDSVKNMDRAMQNVVDICDRYDLAAFGGNEWRENITTSKITTPEVT